MMLLISAGSWIENLVQLFVVFVIFIIVLFLAYLAAKISGNFQANINRRSNIKVVEAYRISNNKYIQIVKIGNRYVALGVGKDEVTFLMELDEESITDFSSMPTSKESFKDVMAQFRSGKGDQIQMVQTKKRSRTDDESCKED